MFHVSGDFWPESFVLALSREHPVEAKALWFIIWKHIGALPVGNVVDLDRERTRKR